MAVDAGIAEALVDLGEAGGVMVTFWTHAGEAVDAVDTGAAVVTGVDRTLVDVEVTHGTWKRGGGYVKSPNIFILGVRWDDGYQTKCVAGEQMISLA